MAEKLWRVTLVRETHIYVAAENGDDAREVAGTADESGEVDWFDAETDAFASEVTALHPGDRGDGVFSDDDDEDRTAAEVLAGRKAPAIERAEWAARKPSTLPEIVAWLGEAPGVAGGPRPWWGACDGGAAASDGHALLFVLGAAAPEATYRGDDPWRPAADKVLASVADRADARGGRVAIAALRRWAKVDGDGCAPARVLGVAFDRRKVAGWVLPAAEASGADAIEIDVAGPRDALLFTGPGWRAIVMPLSGLESDVRELVAEPRS